ncbi:MAG: PD40 domain-containing protein [Bacteroidales bacterium]|nr:PD40 domain-containing protein [Bacteroidales bacterium]
MIKKIQILLILILLSFTYVANAQEEARLLRFPNVHENNVVFSYAGDLYIVDINGGVARRLTSHPGYEMFAKFSPDGKYIAFTGQYDGNTEVYVIPATGGVPKRVTYTATLDRDDVGDRMGPNNIVMTWTPDSKNIIFRSRCKSYNSFRGQLYSVPLEGGMPTEVPIEDGGFCSYSPDGKYLAFNKIFREFRTWKYYEGGMADDVWIYDFASKKAIKLFENPAQDIFPMWNESKIFFASDRDRTMNIFSFDLETDNITKVTNFKDYDVKFPSIGGDNIVFENAGYIYNYNIKDGSLNKISIFINNDFASTRNKMVDASKNIGSIDVSPKGDYILLAGRGDVFIVPAIEGVTKNITRTPGVHERNAVWSPDGKYIAYLSDKTGEFEVFIQKADGSEPAVQLTANAETYKFPIKWSPDSKKILWSDKLMRLRYVDIDSKIITEVDKSNYWEIRSFNWSPDSKWITYSLPNFEAYNKIMLFDTQTKQKHEVTTGWYSSTGPVFSKDGKYLVFVSARSFSPMYNDLDWNTAYNNMQKIYFVLLSKDTPNPLAKVQSFNPDAKDEEKKEDETIVVKIDIDGIGSRLIALPIRPAYYWSVYATNDKIYYKGQSYEEETSTLYMYDLKKQKETQLATGVSFHIPWEGDKMILVKSGKYAIIDIPTVAIDFASIKYANTSDMKFITDFDLEYKQIFDETWRQMRDFFYDPNMHGVDWDSMYNKYAVLLPYVNHRNDLNYIMGELIGELSIGHAYVSGGDVPETEKIYMGLLGGLFSKDASGYFKIDEILKGASWDQSRNSPLAEPGININVGEFIIAINGIETKTVENIYELLVNTAGRPTELTINTTPSKTGVRNVVVVPLKSEADLYYYQWVENNLAYVTEKTNGQVGYIHIPDMSSEGMNMFVEYFYPQFRKKALIIDDRGNGGGNVSPIITEILKREMVMQEMWRNVSNSGPTPDKTHVGPKVLLLDEYSASDGDLFPYQFKNYGMGTLIGKRSWGGVTGIRGSLPFIDGGDLRKPEYGKFSKDGSKWVIEGYGVDPDIEVENNPADVFQGKDAQLDKAIEVILEQIKTYPDALKPNPPFPDKSGNK